MGLMEMGKRSTQGWFPPPTVCMDEGGPSGCAQLFLWVLGGHGERLPEKRARVKHLVFSCNGAMELPFALLMPSP